MSKKGKNRPIEDACETLRLFGGVQPTALAEEMRLRLQNACHLLMEQPPEALHAHQQKIAAQARDVLDGLGIILPGVSRKMLKQHGEIVRDDPVKHGRRALLIKHWHGHPYDLLNETMSRIYLINHQRAAGDALSDLQRAAEQKGNLYFLFEPFQYAAKDQTDPVRNEQHGYMGGAAEEHRKMRARARDELLRAIVMTYNRVEDKDYFLTQVHQYLQPMMPVMQWLFQNENMHLHLQGRPKERTNAYSNFEDRIKALAFAADEPTDEQLLHAKSTFERERALDNEIRHGFVKEQCATIPDDANVVVLYGGAHIREGFIDADTAKVGIEGFLQDQFDISVLEPHEYATMSAGLSTNLQANITLSDMRTKILRERQRRPARDI